MAIGAVKPDVIAKPAASTQPAALVEPNGVEKFDVDKPMPFMKHAEKPDQSVGMVKHEWLKEANDALFDALQRDSAAERNAASSPGNASHLQLHGAILAFLQDAGNGNVEGVAFATICSHVEPTSTDRVREALDQLVIAGLVYTTDAEDHFFRL